MKRRVRAWLSTWVYDEQMPPHGADTYGHSFYWVRAQAENDVRLNGRCKGVTAKLVPCTIEYDDGKKPAKKGAKRAK